MTGWRKRRWSLGRAFLGLLVLYFVLRWFEHSQVYHPSRELEASGGELGRPFEDVYFQTADGRKLNGWFFPADKEWSRGHFVCLLCPGNAGKISHRLAPVAPMP